ncbi:L-histidine N(alpha)-methyltransferase [Rhodoblastus sp. 17X3]|uniref:L-histidine N(alpha)-methyltransferase n=1 Tax=Rhodoblastus sp. 17X3 TaxID=3047026 RepID=UPI0024B7B40D|nr:L-histidine N(alpha)-methyltransferase [Rhodoblastus sp. 17X3]MDI9847671.1 L-histidine N(alpha)-methyltransferase [Rhodoblastus sp. 17X3]
MMFDGFEVQSRWDEAFRAAVVGGLSRAQKSIPCCWLYDERGSELFNEITRLEEYYPTRAETEILLRWADEMAGFCGEDILLVEYGAGAGIKTEILIEALDKPRLYVPIDIAGDVLAQTASRMRDRFPDLETLPIVADFNRDFDLPAGLPPGWRTAFFPGSTIGNLNRSETVAFLSRLHRHVEGRGMAIIGVDLKKDLGTLLSAYDDGAGVTAAFNLNLLARINRELDGDFPLDRFVHQARWNESESAVEMHLVSLDTRVVSACGRQFAFHEGETIHTESSRKYALDSFRSLAEKSAWRLSRAWLDDEDRFAVLGLEASP